MEKPLKCVPLLSLEEIALRNLSAILWNSSDILASLMKLRYHKNTIKEWQWLAAEWETIIDKIKNKIMKLKLLEPLTKQMVNLVRPIGFEIRTWENFHGKIFNFSCFEIFEQDSAKLCFTTAGTVDDRRMAQEIVRCDKINVVTRYKMACAYWLEDCIPILWQELSEEHKEFFYGKNAAARGLEFSWPHFFKDGQSNLDSYLRKLDRNLSSFNQKAFELSAKTGFKATAEYFFGKLSYEETEASLMRSAHDAVLPVIVPDDVKGRLRNVLHYLLSLMTPEQQMDFVRIYPVEVMSCFLDWPRQAVFSENAALICPFVFPDQYEDLLGEVLRYDKRHFPAIFKQSPLDFKKYVVGTNPDCIYFSIRFLTACCDSGDFESIKLMFRSADVKARTEFVFDELVLQFFHDSISRDKWRLVEVCLREAALSGEDRKRLKDSFLRCLNEEFFLYNHFAPYGTKSDVPQMNDRDPKLKRFFDFLDGTDASIEEERKGQKRKLKDCSS